MHLNFARFRASDSAWFTHSHGTLTSWTSCGFVNMARKAEIARWKLFFSV